jgi:aspartyl protease family protein
MKITKTNLFFSAIWLLLAWLVFNLADNALHPNNLKNIGHGKTVTLQRGPDGHYRAEALINGKKVNVLVDTGATGVAISQRLADDLNIKSHNAINTTTANGESVSYMTRLNTVELGGIQAHDVGAMIAPGLEGDVLLGMTFLGRMDVRLFQNTMTIKQVESNQ